MDMPAPLRTTEPPRIAARQAGAKSPAEERRGERYRVGSLIGTGLSGPVFRAIDTLTGETVALKRLSPELRTRAEVASRFARLGAAVRRVESAHVVRVLEIAREADGVPFLVLELVEGTDLAHILETNGPLAARRALHLGTQIVEALRAAHAVGLFHRRLLPRSCLVTDVAGDPEFVKLIGFDAGELVAILDATLDSPATRHALAYFAPEQVKSARNADGRSDLYSAAVLLYEMLTRRRPFESGDRNALVLAICTEPPPPLRDARPDLSLELCSAIERALVKDPNARFQSADELLAALRATPEARGEIAPWLGTPPASVAPIAPVAPVSPMAPLPSTAPHGSVDVFGKTMIGAAPRPTVERPKVAVGPLRWLRLHHVVIVLLVLALIPELTWFVGTLARPRARLPQPLGSSSPTSDVPAEASPFTPRPVVTEPPPSASSTPKPSAQPGPSTPPKPKPKPKPTPSVIWPPTIVLPPIFAPAAPAKSSSTKPKIGG